MPPKVIGPYRVLETLGTGGVGTVYRAVDRRTNEPAALKLLSTGPALDPRAARVLLGRRTPSAFGVLAGWGEVMDHLLGPKGGVVFTIDPEAGGV